MKSLEDIYKTYRTLRLPVDIDELANPEKGYIVTKSEVKKKISTYIKLIDWEIKYKKMHNIKEDESH